MRVGFIGLGKMGSGMAANMLRFCQAEEIPFSVYDINPDAMQSLCAIGAKGAPGIAELAGQSDILFTSLPSSKQINEIAVGENGLLATLPVGAIWFETSTNDVSEWQVLRDTAPNHLTLVDAPVTGGTEGAEQGTLTILLGMENSLTEAQMALLKSCTKKQVVMGPPGAGYIAKLSQLHLNYLVAQGIGEALMMGAKGGLDLAVLHDVLSHSCAQSYVADNYIPKVLDGSYDPSFTLGLAKKDMALIQALGNHLDIDMPLGQSVLDSYVEALAKFGHEAPHLSIVKLIEESSKTLLRI